MSSSVLQTNRRALETRFPGLWNEVYSRPPSLEEEPLFSPAKTGDLTARWKGVALASAYDPVSEARRAVPEIDASDFAVLGGLGLGYFAEAVVERYPDLPVLIAEPDPGWFHRLLEVRDLSLLFSNPFVSLLLGGPPHQVGTYLERFSCTQAAWLPSRAVWQIFPGWLKGLEDALQAFLAKARVNDLTLRRFFPMWFRNREHNLVWAPVIRRVSVLKDLLKGGRAVIAAAGPSLGTSLEWIRNHRHEFCLIAVDTAWPTLKRWGLVPDFLVFMDGQYWNSRHVDGPVDPETLVVAEFASHPRALRQAPARTFVCTSTVPLFRDEERAFWGDLGTLKSGGSVATTAWELAVHLGCCEVAFAGLDLGFPTGQTHVRGSQFEERLHVLSTRLRPSESLGFRLLHDSQLTQRPSVDGGWIPSDPRMDLYRDWFALSFQERREVRAYNLSPFGSVIPGLLPAKDLAWSSVAQSFPSIPQTEPLGVPRQKAAGDPGFLARTLEKIREAQKTGPGPAVPEFARILDEAERQGRALWGRETWNLVFQKAHETWRLFPGPRSLGALERAWELGVNLGRTLLPGPHETKKRIRVKDSAPKADDIRELNKPMKRYAVDVQKHTVFLFSPS